MTDLAHCCGARSGSMLNCREVPGPDCRRRDQVSAQPDRYRACIEILPGIFGRDPSGWDDLEKGQGRKDILDVSWSPH